MPAWAHEQETRLGRGNQRSWGWSTPGRVETRVGRWSACGEGRHPVSGRGDGARSPGSSASWASQGLSGKEPTCQRRRHKRPRFDASVGKIPWSRNRQPAPVLLPGESHGQRSLGATVHGRRESDTTYLLTRPHASTAGGVGLIPGRGTKIPQAEWPKKILFK